MDNLSRLEKALDAFEKNVDISFAGPTPSSLLARQDLEQAIVVLSDRLTPFRDRVSRIKGEGLAHLWNQRTRLDTTAQGPNGLVTLFYADGALPNQLDPAYVQKTAAYKYLGVTAVITGPIFIGGICDKITNEKDSYIGKTLEQSIPRKDYLLFYNICYS
ncbi:MAG: hypothetical protein ACYDBV_13960 [Nitrospiria bacterium]